jgi:hypothetical protein
MPPRHDLAPRRTYSLVANVTIPSQSDSLGPFSLFQPTQVELEPLVVKVDRGDGRVLDFELFAGVEDCVQRACQLFALENEGSKRTDPTREAA